MNVMFLCPKKFQISTINTEITFASIYMRPTNSTKNQIINWFKPNPIKATMKNNLTFPVDHIPDYYIGIRIHRDGTFTEIFNGPGALAWEAVKNRKATKTNLHSVSIAVLNKLNAKVQATDRIPKRSGNPLQPTSQKGGV